MPLTENPISQRVHKEKHYDVKRAEQLWIILGDDITPQGAGRDRHHSYKSQTLSQQQEIKRSGGTNDFFHHRFNVWSIKCQKTDFQKPEGTSSNYFFLSREHSKVLIHLFLLSQKIIKVDGKSSQLRSCFSVFGNFKTGKLKFEEQRKSVI